LAKRKRKIPKKILTRHLGGLLVENQLPVGKAENFFPP
jgi:hypothetical protein